MTDKRPRKDHAALAAAGEISAAEVAKMLGVSPGTLKRLRDNGAGPSCRAVHKRLYAYVRAEVEALRDAIAGAGKMNAIKLIASRGVAKGADPLAA